MLTDQNKLDHFRLLFFVMLTFLLQIKLSWLLIWTHSGEIVQHTKSSGVRGG